MVPDNSLAMLAILKRLIVIAFGYALASLLTGLVVAVVLAVVPNGTFVVGPPLGFKSFVQLMLLASFMVLMFGSAPALAVILLGERSSVRTPWVYAACGAVIGLLLGLLFRLVNWFPIVGLVAGCAAGLVYWRVAGRNAGALLASQPTLRTPFLALLAIICVVTFGAVWGFYFGIPG